MKIGGETSMWYFVVALITSTFLNTSKAMVSPTADKPWRALHLNDLGSDKKLEALGQQLPQLAKLGINCIILEVNYGFNFQSHPELREGKSPITKLGARQFLSSCRNNGMELVPEFQCVGHQSWKEHTSPLLTKYPELDLTPGAFPNNEGVFCRNWDPINPKTNKIVFSLIDEIIDAFEARAFHIGMDEILLLSSPQARSTKNLDPADVFAKVVSELHDHIVGKRRLTMLMWADRLIDADKFNLDEREGSKIGTAPAVDTIPKDIILCPWHYEVREHYQSVPMLMSKGFRVMPTSWNNTEATLALIRYARKHSTDRLVGHVFVTWSQPREHWEQYESLVKGLELLHEPSSR